MFDLAAIEPARVTAAFLVFGSAVIALCAYVWSMSDELVGGIGLVWSTFIGLINSIVVRNRVTPVEGLLAGD